MSTTGPKPVATKGVALHRQIFLVLRDEISRGLYPDGRLAHEEALCERFGVSRITVRRALNDMAALGIVERRHGRGTYVLETPALSRPPLTLSLMDSLRASVMEMHAEVLSLGHETPPHDVAKLLQLSQGEKAIHAVRVRLNLSGSPANLTDCWLKSSFGTGVTRTSHKKSTLYEILLSQGVRFGRIVQEFSATVGDPDRSNMLKTEVGAPLLKMVRLMHDHDQMPIYHLTAYLPADRASVLMETTGDDVNTLAGGRIVLD